MNDEQVITYKNRLNVYTCPDGHKTVTIDREEGVTPFMIDCKHTSLSSPCSCGKNATSSFYRCDPTLEPTYEWYKPGPSEKLSRWEKEHCDQGGLLLRRICEKPAACGTVPTIKKRGRNEPCICGSGRKYKHCCIVR